MVLPGYEILAFLAALLCFQLLSRHFIFRKLESASGADHRPARVTENLRPAEIAFLVRKGDTTHALIVLAADLMQRSLKKSDDLSFLDNLTEYEKNMWTISKKAVTNWAQKKSKKVLIGESSNPVAIAKRLSFVYKFVTGSLRKVVGDAISDPKKLRKYFSPQGLWRVIADFSAAGYKQAFEEELRDDLLKRGLLTEAGARSQAASLLLATGILGLIGTAVVATISFEFLHVALLVWLGSLLSAFVLRTVLIVRQLLPFYEELYVVADQIDRNSKRLRLIKIILKSIDSINWIIALLATVIVSCVFLAMIKLFYLEAGWSLVLVYMALAATNFATADLLFGAIDLNLNDYPTKAARAELKTLKEDLKELTPLDSFKEYLDSQEYNPRFSKLIAVYGIETLFILV